MAGDAALPQKQEENMDVNNAGLKGYKQISLANVF